MNTDFLPSVKHKEGPSFQEDTTGDGLGHDVCPCTMFENSELTL